VDIYQDIQKLFLSCSDILNNIQTYELNSTQAQRVQSLRKGIIELMITVTRAFDTSSVLKQSFISPLVKTFLKGYENKDSDLLKLLAIIVEKTKENVTHFMGSDFEGILKVIVNVGLSEVNKDTEYIEIFIELFIKLIKNCPQGEK